MSLNIPDNLRYTKTHEWAKQDAGAIVVGISSHAQEELRDVVYVEVPPVGKAVEAGAPLAVVESVKAAFDIYAPVSGTVTRANAALAKHPQLVNQDCYGDGWFFAIKPSQPDQYAKLMTADEYQKLIKETAH